MDKKDFLETFANTASNDVEHRALRSLQEEESPEIFWKDLEGLALQIKQAGQFQRAHQLLTQITLQKQIPEVAERAQREINAMEGGGSVGLRMENFFQTLLPQICEPTSLSAMVAGGLVYRGLNLMGLRLLLPASRLGSLSGLMGRRALASGVALMGESATFAGVHQVTQSFLDPPSGTQNPFVEEWARTAILLGSLRMFGFGFQALGREFQSLGLAGPRTPWALSQLGTYTGILAAGHLEHWAMPTPGENPKTSWSGALATLLHFNLAGSLARSLTPKSLRKVEQRMEIESQRLILEKKAALKDQWNPWSHGGFGPGASSMALAFPGAAYPSRSNPFPSVIPKPMLMIEGEPGSRDPTDFIKSSTRNTQWYIQKIDELLGKEGLFLKTLAQTHLQDEAQIGLAVQRIHHILEHVEVESSRSSYVNWITRLALDPIVENKHSLVLDRMIEILNREVSLASFEYYAATQLPPARFSSWADHMPIFFRSRNASQSRINDLPLSQEAKTNLWRMVFTQRKGEKSVPYYIPEPAFLDRLEAMQNLGGRWLIIDKILAQAGQSPLAMLRLKRLHHLLESELHAPPGAVEAQERGMMGSKLRELADPLFHFRGEGPGQSPPIRENMGNHSLGGYLGKHPTQEILFELNSQIRELLNPHRVNRAFDRSRDIISKHLAQHRGVESFTQENIIKALELLGDPFSQQLAQDLRHRNVLMEVHHPSSYNDRLEEIYRQTAGAQKRPFNPDEVPEGSAAFYVAPGDSGTGLNRGLILVRLPQGTKGISESPTEIYFDLLSRVVHEYQHHLFGKPEELWTENLALKEETGAHARQYLWEAQHGDTTKLQDSQRGGNAGFALYFRDVFERRYWSQFRPWEK